MTTKTKWATGDKVRLTGDRWPEDVRGTVVTLTGLEGYNDGFGVLPTDRNYGSTLIHEYGSSYNRPGRAWAVEYVEPAGWVAENDWTSVGKGDEVRFTNGQSVLVGIVDNAYSEDNIDIHLAGGGRQWLEVYKSEGWKLEVHPKPKPTYEDGYYVSRGKPRLVYRVRDGETAMTAIGGGWVETNQPNDLVPLGGRH